MTEALGTNGRKRTNHFGKLTANGHLNKNTSYFCERYMLYVATWLPRYM